MCEKFAGGFMRKTVISFVLSLFWATNAFASGYTNQSIVTEVRYVSAGFILMTESPHGDPDNCGRNKEILIPSSMLNDEKLVSLLVTGMASKRPVRILVNGCNGTAPDAFAVADSLFDVTVYSD